MHFRAVALAAFAWLAISVTAFALPGCGGQTTTVTATVTETVTTSASAPDAATGDPAAFCDSSDGDAIVQADSAAGDAFNSADTAMMLKQEKIVLRLARKAPIGSECAVTALESLRFNWNNGAENFSGVDLAAKAAAIRAFQKAHGLRSADIVY
jgi:hypothetical protein